MKFKLTERKKLLVYKIALFVFAFVLAFLPSTVSRNLEVNSRVVVEMLGVDGGDGVELTAQYVMPTETDGATTKSVVTVKSDTLGEAVEMINTALGRRAELGQCSVVVVGKELEPSILGTLMTSTDVTADVYLTAAEDKAKDAVKDITEFMKKSGATEADFIAYSAKKAHIATNTLLNFLSDLGSASHTAYMPLVQMLEEKSEGGQDDSGGGSGDSSGGGGSGGGGSGESSGGESSGGDQKEKVGMKVEKLAVYGKGGRIGTLEQPAARGVAWVSAPIEKSIVTADVEYGGKTVKDVSARLLKKRVKIDVSPKSNSAAVKLEVTLEPGGDKFNVLDAEGGKGVNDAMRKGFAKAIGKEIKAAYEDALALDCDPLFVGRQFYRYEPKFFADGYALGQTSVDFTVDVKLK